ncbi:MAG: hypothetical protein SFU83_09585 [Meiothermus sp.]|nr:hypothetical protein [Meiothermus sp.]
MKLRLSTVLLCPVDEAFGWVKSPALLRHIARPLVVFTPLEPAQFPEVWEPGDYRVGMKLLNLIPLGEQTIGLRLEPEWQAPGQRYEVLDDGHSRLIPRWRHRIRLEALPDGSTRYTDELELEAGLLTKLVWLFAYAFYAYRQYRWRQLVHERFRPLQTA